MLETSSFESVDTQCEMCTEPPSGTVVHRIGDDGPIVDLGHLTCYADALEAMRRRRREAAGAVR
ncbi:hypothetical protein [Streptacidiphilus carbonis]|uniref:hypothetical protein n=1 Tax=Streptacidiphilus carbonis TaxID=105422 RepID=UPI0005A9359B|nr:hypothetical protein [Streptacidiphilus carbonis]